jgi:hypothetical protein
MTKFGIIPLAHRRSVLARGSISLVLVSAVATAFGCGNTESQTTTSTIGGSNATSAVGGSAANTQGGKSSSVGTGGAVANGGGVATGGMVATGGQPSTTGGADTGGFSASIGGANTTGGKAATGGADQSGGTSTTGGARTGAGGGTDRSVGGSGGTSKGDAGAPGSGGVSKGGAAGSVGSTGGSNLGGQGGLGAGGQSGGQPGTGGGGSGVAGSAACASTLPAVTDYAAAAGPFATSTESNTGPDGKCVIYRPKTLGENGFMHAPIVFGPGIGMQASQLSGLLLSFASHGFVVIGTGVLNGGPNDPANLAAMKNALDWMIKQNSQAGNYQGKLAVNCAISMGYSVGGTAAVELGGHEAVATTVSIHGHVASSAMHGPLLQTSGDKDTVGRPMQQQTFDKSQVQTAFGTVSGADHGYIQSNNGGVERPAIIAWMRYWINGDTGARSYFWGTDCVLCKSPWMDYKTKNWK